MLDRYAKALSDDLGFDVDFAYIYEIYQDELERSNYSWEKCKELALRERAIEYGNMPNRPPTEEELEGMYQEYVKEKSSTISK